MSEPILELVEFPAEVRVRLHAMTPRILFIITAWVASFFMLSPPYAVAWNTPGHMLSGSIAYQILRTESPATIATAKAILERHPWYYSRWKEQLDKLPESQRDEMLFMLAPRWADDIRTKDQGQHRRLWHYINLPFKPDVQSDTIRSKPPEAVNILTALAENEQIAKTETDPVRRAITLTWLFHLVGDVHQPLHSVQIFTTDYPNGDRGGNQICVRASETAKSVDLHRFWDRVIITSANLTRLRNEAAGLRNRPEFARRQLRELNSAGFEAWAKESFNIAATIAYRNGETPGTAKGSAKDCRDVIDAKVLPSGYARTAGRIADRRIMLVGYRLADLLKRF